MLSFTAPRLLVGFEFDEVANTGTANVLNDFSFQFLDDGGADVWDQLRPANR